MALTDWTEQLNGSGIAASSAQAQAGSISMEFQGTSGDDNILTNDQSVTDAPTEGRVVGWWRYNGTSNATYFGPCVRYIDNDNWYAITVEIDTFSGPRVALIESVSGAETILTRPSAGGMNLNADTWQKFRFTFWEDAGTFFARVEQEQSGSFSLLGNDMSDADNHHSAGGGIGVGHFSKAGADNFGSSDVRGSEEMTWNDEVELFY